MQEYGVYIDGEWSSVSGDAVFETINPTSKNTLVTFAQATADDVLRAIESAKKALPDWRQVPPPKRGEILLDAARIMRRRKQELGELVTTEMGKVIS